MTSEAETNRPELLKRLKEIYSDTPTDQPQQKMRAALAISVLEEGGGMDVLGLRLIINGSTEKS